MRSVKMVLGDDTRWVELPVNCSIGLRDDLICLSQFIEQALTIVEQSGGQYHVLSIITDGHVALNPLVIYNADIVESISGAVEYPLNMRRGIKLKYYSYRIKKMTWVVLLGEALRVTERAVDMVVMEVQRVLVGSGGSGG
ncbi:E3 ubiquitin protein ligase RGLG2-like protein [Tanacetum coccineum]